MNSGKTEKDYQLQFVKKADNAKVVRTDEKHLTTVPHLLLREAVGAEVVIIVLCLVSLFFNAPLEQIANPDHTPNPAKAPWYFLGLQELLHYFPPVVAGVLIPGLVVIALVVIPYFGVNVKPRSLSALDSRHTRLKITTFAAIITLGMLPFDCWPVAGVTVLTWGLIIFSLAGKGKSAGWLREITIPAWIMIWFTACATILIIIGTFFRGPGWGWAWPWVEGIY